MAGAWVGLQDRSRIQVSVAKRLLGQGAAAALPIWAFFMKRVYADKNRLNINPAANASSNGPRGLMIVM